MVLLIFFGSVARAEEDLDAGGNVKLETQEDYTKSYKQRRSTHGMLLGFSKEDFYPIDYQSLFGDAFVEDIVGSDSINLINFDIGYKYNVSVGSASFLFSYATGARSDGISGRRLSLTKQGLSANVALDGILEEPWAVPYLQVGVHQFNISESTDTASESATTSMSFNYRYGLLFQLDWLEHFMDPNARGDRLRSSGLENTYIDVYYTDYMPSGDAQDAKVLGAEGDPNLLSSGEMGIGLKLEF